MLIKTKITFILGLLICFGMNAQSDSSSTTSTIDLMYGYRIFNSNFYNQLNTNTHFDGKLPVQLIGVGISDNYKVGSHLDCYGHISYSQVIPQIIQLPGINCKLTGFVLGLDYGLSIGSKAFKVLLGTGFNTGRLKIYENNQVDEKNPFFSPKICIQPKLAIWKIVLSVRGEYEFDVSKSGWRKTFFSSNNQVILANLRQSCYTVLFSIGMAI